MISIVQPVVKAVPTTHGSWWVCQLECGHEGIEVRINADQSPVRPAPTVCHCEDCSCLAARLLHIAAGGSK